jgi:hypothetical protein
MISKDTSGRTADEAIARCQNELRKLGAQPDGLSLDKIESTMLALKKSMPFFKFRTWRGKKKVKGQPGYNETYDGPNAPEPRVQYDWRGATEYSGEGGESGVVDETGTVEPSANGEYTDQSPLDMAHLDDLLSKANDMDGEAQDELEKMAIAAGKTKKDVDGSTSWEQVVEWIKEANSSGNTDDPNARGADQDWVPAKGDNHKYSLKDPKNPKKAKLVEVEVLTVNEEARTVTLKNLDTGKPIGDGKKALAVSWDDLKDYDS